METRYYPMVDAYPQIKEKLDALPDNPTVTERWPREERKGSLIVVSEITNHSTSIKVVDQIAYQIDVWADDEDALRRLCDGVDQAMLQIGFLRTLASPLDWSPEGARRTFRYGRRVDKRTGRLID